jgi:hypothetical protein
MSVLPRRHRDQRDQDTKSGRERLGGHAAGFSAILG